MADFPTQYDVIVLGTGLQECIVAAACARLGKTVLHMDVNEYYGGEWATHSFDAMQSWISSHQQPVNVSLSPPTADFVKADEICYIVNPRQHVFNVKQLSYIPDTLPEPVIHEATQSGSGDHLASDPDPVSPETPKPPLPKWTLQRMKEESRKFNIDLAPKVLFSHSEMVNLLISSNIARYAEFKAITRVLTWLEDRLEQVPCSRADVFSTKNVSVVEKRQLMKLLESILHYETQPAIYKGFEKKTFAEFLKSRNLTPNVFHFVLHSIAMVSESASLLQGFQSSKQFLESLGRYGNTPFLWTMYGSGELPQCFCRMCAVFGGVYYLKRSADAIITDKDGRCVAIVSDNTRLDCEVLFMNEKFAPKEFIPDVTKKQYISRGIFLTDSSVDGSKEQVTLLRIPQATGFLSTVSVLEVSANVCACPSTLYTVHMTCESVLDTAEADLKMAVLSLFDSPEIAETFEEQPSSPEKLPGTKKKPSVLWALYFNLVDYIRVDLQPKAPANVFLTSGPSGALDYDEDVRRAKQLFERAFPEDIFLPRAPDPEEIVLEGQDSTNPSGNEAEADPESQPSVGITRDSAEEGGEDESVPEGSR